MPRSLAVLLGPPESIRPSTPASKPSRPRPKVRQESVLKIDYAESLNCTQQINYAVKQAELVHAGEKGRFKKTYMVSEAAAEVIAERFEKVCERLGWNYDTYADVLASVMPEYYADPELAKVVSDRPKGTPERVDEYASRIAAGLAARHPHDKEPDLLGLVNLQLGGRINRDRFRVAAWEGDPDDN